MVSRIRADLRSLAGFGGGRDPGPLPGRATHDRYHDFTSHIVGLAFLGKLPVHLPLTISANHPMSGSYSVLRNLWANKKSSTNTSREF